MKTQFCDVMFGWVSGGWCYSHFVLQLVSLRLLLPLFPACTHADCSSNYKMEESPAEPEERSNGEAGRPPDASPWGVGRDAMVYPMMSPWWVGKTHKKGGGGSRDLCALPL